MNARSLFLTLSVVILATIHLAAAQQPEKVPRIGLLMSASTSEAAAFIEAFRQGLRELGYVEGKNLVLEIRGGEAKPDRLSDLAAELVRLKVNIIVTGGSLAIRAAKEATHVIPIVMVTGSDPVETGLVASLARPGGNITGLTHITTELIGKRLELLLEVVPGVRRVAVLTVYLDRARFMATEEYKEMEAAARVLGVKLQILSARDPRTIDNVFVAMAKERTQALVMIPSPRYLQHQAHILNHAARNRLPSIYPHSSYVKNGGVMSYGVNYPDQFRRSAIYVDKILKGAKPAELPVEQPMKFELIINLKIAKQIGLTIPPNVLARADKVIR